MEEIIYSLTIPQLISNLSAIADDAECFGRHDIASATRADMVALHAEWFAANEDWMWSDRTLVGPLTLDCLKELASITEAAAEYESERNAELAADRYASNEPCDDPGYYEDNFIGTIDPDFEVPPAKREYLKVGYWDLPHSNFNAELASAALDDDIDDQIPF